ncbi:beta-lactamase family protein [Vibrio profundum]|uniref:serine hydrolase domain-containing protein n=1 Tax=Vibrio profundum TaxID=2910247 RepID=UPI003D0BEED3
MDLQVHIRKVIVSCSIVICSTNAFAKSTSTSQQLQQVVEVAQNRFDINAVSMAILTPSNPSPQSFVTGSISMLNHTAIEQDSMFKVGSITKTFTAALIAKAIDERKLQLNDKLGQLLPQYSKWKDITVEQLVNQTSGIIDYDATPDWWKNLVVEKDKTWLSSELVQLSYNSKKAFSSGHGWQYSNTNYVLLGMILAKVYHQPAEQLITHLIEKTNLKQTYYSPTGYKQSIHNKMVHGYFRNQFDETNMNGSWLRTAGALLSTPVDMVEWMHTRISSPNAKGFYGLNQFKFTDTENGRAYSSSSAAGYSFGVFKRDTPSGPLYFTPGLTSGYVSMLVYAPCYDTYFAYSSSKAPIYGFHDFMLSKTMEILAHDERLLNILNKMNLPSYCHPSASHPIQKNFLKPLIVGNHQHKTQPKSKS